MNKISTNRRRGLSEWKARSDPQHMKENKASSREERERGLISYNGRQSSVDSRAKVTQVLTIL